MADASILIIPGVLMLLTVGLAAIGSLGGRETTVDFFAAGRSVGGMLFVLGVFAMSLTLIPLAMFYENALRLDTPGRSTIAWAAGASIVGTLGFFFVGLRSWAIAKRYHLFTQGRYLRDRFESPLLGAVWSVVCASLVLALLVFTLAGAGRTVFWFTTGCFPSLFIGEGLNPSRVSGVGAVPPWLTELGVCLVAGACVGLRGLRSAIWANATLALVALGGAALMFVFYCLHGAPPPAGAWPQAPVQPHHLSIVDLSRYLGLLLLPLGIAVLPSVQQHGLAARNSAVFRPLVIGYPLLLLLLLAPLLLIGSSAGDIHHDGFRAGLPDLLANHRGVASILLTILLAMALAGVSGLALALTGMLIHDAMLPIAGTYRFTDRQLAAIGRIAAGGVLVIAYAASRFGAADGDLGLSHLLWWFGGLAALFPVLVAAYYWRGATRTGVLAALAATLVAWLSLQRDNTIFTDVIPLLLLPPAVLLLLVNAGTLIVVSLFTRQPSHAALHCFCPTATQLAGVTARRPADPDGDAGTRQSEETLRDPLGLDESSADPLDVLADAANLPSGRKRRPPR